MRKFIDTQGRAWAVKIDVAQVKRVRGELGRDLVALIDGGIQALGKLLSDPVAVVDTLWVLCQGQHDGVTDEDFGRSMGGDALQDAAQVFVQELLDFFPDRSLRVVLRKGERKAREAMERLVMEEEQRLDAMTVEEVVKAMRGPGPSSGDAPASSASTPTP